MKSFGLFSKPTTKPYRVTNGITFDLRGGDVVQPLALTVKNPDGTSVWYTPPGFKRVLHFWMPLPLLPWLSARFGRFGVYMGAKCFGMDLPEYPDTLHVSEGEIYEGSKAIMLFTMRFTGRLT